MGTPFKVVNEAFLARIEQDEWSLVENLEDLESDFYQLMKMAINRFLFPRVALTYNEDEACFDEELGLEEINYLAVYMKNEWLKRKLANWELIQQQYHTSDFSFLSQANHMSKLKELVELSNKECLNTTNLYSRVINHTPYDWTKLAGGTANG
jgi:hypothetical protein